MPRRDKTSRVTPKGNGVPGEDGRGRGGDGNFPAIQDNKASGYISSGKEMTSKPGPAAPQIPQRGMATGRVSKVSTHRHPNRTKGARPEHGALSRRKYGLLAPYDPEDNPASAEPQELEDGQEAAMSTGVPDVRETGDRNGQRTLLASSHPEDTGEEQRPPKRQRVLNACSHQRGGREGTPHPSVRASRAQPGEGGGYPDQAARSASAHPGDGGGGGPPTQ